MFIHWKLLTYQCLSELLQYEVQLWAQIFPQYMWPTNSMERQGHRTQSVSNPFSLLIGRNALRQLWQRREKPPNGNSWPSSRWEQCLRSTIFEDILDIELDEKMITVNIFAFDIDNQGSKQRISGCYHKQVFVDFLDILCNFMLCILCS